MSIERIFYCDAPDCEHHFRTAGKSAVPFITVNDGKSLHFCSWDCVLKKAAAFPPVETIPFADLGEVD